MSTMNASRRLFLRHAGMWHHIGFGFWCIADRRTDRLLGGIYALLAASFFAVYLLIVANVRRHSSTATIMFYMSLVAALGLVPFAFAMSPTLLSGSLHGWLILLGLAVVSHAGGQGLVTFALAHLSTSFSSMTNLMQTAVAAVAGATLVGGSFTELTLTVTVAVSVTPPDVTA